MKFRTHCLIGVIVVLLLASSAAHATSVLWTKYVSVDGSFSFHHPEGWHVTESDSVVVVDGPSSDEQLCMCILPYYRNWSPEEHAQLMLSALRSENPDLAASGWEADSEGRAVLFDLTHGDGAQQYRGMGLVLKDSGAEQALWFHYIAPSSGYSRDRGASTLQGFIGSIASGSASQSPVVGRAERIAENADAFMFVLEFALGSPLSLSDERMIRDELEKGWSQRFDAELAEYDDYPQMVSLIMAIGDQRQLTEVQQVVAEAVLEWLGGSDPNDPVVKMIRAHVLEGDRTLVDGDPPLTETAAASYAELVAYADLLQVDPEAAPGSVSHSTVEEIKTQLAQCWLQLGRDERELVQTIPAVWTTLRKALLHGDSSDRERARSIIAKPAPAKGSGDASHGAMSTDELNASMWAHQNMLWASQNTFNHWMWCQGFRSTPFGY